MHYFKHRKLIEIMKHTKIQSYHYLEEMLSVMNASILLVCVRHFIIVVASGATVFLSAAAVHKVDCDAYGECYYE
jgi:hypothetical protein